MKYVMQHEDLRVFRKHRSANVDVFRGKPRTVNDPLTNSETVTATHTMLWPYNLERLVLDVFSHTETDQELIHQDIPDDSEVPLPQVLVEYSLDGETYSPMPVERIQVSSLKGSLGTQRSLILTCRRAIATSVRLTYSSHGPQYVPRTQISPAKLLESEKSKNLISIPDSTATMASSAPKIAIVGDSNSVMRYGWIKGLSQVVDVPADVNASLGASQMAMLVSRLRDLEEHDFDILVINSVVNEFRPHRFQNYNIDVARDILSYITHWCAQKNVVPVFIVWPHLHYLKDIENSATTLNPRVLYRTWCRDLDIPFIDCYQLLYSISNHWSRSISSMFLDDSHLVPFVAQAVGSLVGTALVKLNTRLSIEPSTISDQYELGRSFDVKRIPPAAQGTGAKSRVVETSLVRRQMTVLRERISVTLQVPDGAEAVGLLYNARNSYGAVMLRGSNAWSLRADFSKYEGPNGFPFVTTRSLETPVAAKSGRIEVECVAPNQSQQQDDLANRIVPSRPIDGWHVELGEVIIRLPSSIILKRRVRLRDLDITNDVNMSAVSCS